MPLRIENPYRSGKTEWLRGNLHTHTSCSDGVREPQAVVDAYAKLGYDFLMLSDHDHLTAIESLDPRGMVLIPGNEVTAKGPHILHVGARTFIEPQPERQSVIDRINADGGLAIVNHPNWEKSFAHCPQERLDAWRGYGGIEVYNGVVRRLDGSPIATDRWDRLLGSGRRAWGYANDDSHRPEDDGIAWNMVQSDRTSTAIVDALRSGRCYSSTGVTIESIVIDGLNIELKTRNAQRIVAHSDFGHREATVDGAAIYLSLPEDSRIQYVRFECWGPGESMAWSQPFYLSRS